MRRRIAMKTQSQVLDKAEVHDFEVLVNPSIKNGVAEAETLAGRQNNY